MLIGDIVVHYALIIWMEEHYKMSFMWGQSLGWLLEELYDIA